MVVFYVEHSFLLGYLLSLLFLSHFSLMNIFVFVSWLLLAFAKIVPA